MEKHDTLFHRHANICNIEMSAIDRDRSVKTDSIIVLDELQLIVAGHMDLRSFYSHPVPVRYCAIASLPPRHRYALDGTHGRDANSFSAYFQRALR